MRSSQVGGALTASLIAFGIGLAVVPTASADPSDPAQTDAPAPAPPANFAPIPGPVPAPAPAANTAPPPAANAAPPPAVNAAPPPAANAAPAPDNAPASNGPNPATADACKQFAAAMQYAANNYEDFAYDTAGNGNSVDYSNPSVVMDNQPARTALRQAAGAAMDAANTPGVPPDVSAPMQSWSMHAAQLILIMGLHGGGDALNSTATDMNTDAHNAQLSCAAEGVAAR